MVATARLRIKREAWDALDALRFSTSSKMEFRNATIILMSDVVVARTKASIAHELGCSVSTVDLIRTRYRQEGIEGLLEKKRTGRPSRATPAYREALRQAIQTPPVSLGFAFTVWSVPRLNAYLQKQTRIKFSDGQLTRLLHAEGFTLQRPKHTMKGKRDEAAYAKTAGRLERLKKRPSRTMPRSS